MDMEAYGEIVCMFSVLNHARKKKKRCDDIMSFSRFRLSSHTRDNTYNLHIDLPPAVLLKSPFQRQLIMTAPYFWSPTSFLLSSLSRPPPLPPHTFILQ